ncbi:MFS transporter [Sphaerochaeta halotolerans]|jgi:MFS family permease|uniref:MFS transporter n=1 Tax=Sphaerochaeta halotolerans TaxID=2293840 RepID=A0A372MH76_9SPIR|nr:MFS transporter [Sphaerochaeta halotolerans]MDN5333901.1 maltose/moltooligosaccharide transporter [Sphaerochaeta sp.]RFU94803.1 MFS transporter [Sphaerochaeta halotolerans]
MAKTQKKGLKGYYITTFLIGLGFFTMGLMDPLYDTYVPIFLARFVESKALIGSIMTFDNILAIFLIPIFSAISDRTHTRIGRRMPFIVICLPITAVAFGLIPFSALNSLWLLILLVFVLNIFKQAVRGPVVALMPDMIPGDLRSEANGVINTMGGIAAIVGTVGLARLMDVPINLPGRGPTTEILAFPISSVLVIIAVLLIFFFVKERPATASEQSEKKEPILHSLKVIFAEQDKSALFILLSLLFWFIGYQGILPFVGLYSKDILRTSSGTASLAAGMVGIAYALFAIPSGIVAHRVGRKKTIRISLAILVVLLAGIFFHDPLTSGMSDAFRQYTFWALLFCFGIFWVSVVTNSFPMLWQMSSYQTVGIYTGLYYFFSQLASIISPPLTGAFIDLFGFRAIFLYGSASMLIAFFLMGRVTRGEPSDDETETLETNDAKVGE